MSHVRESVEPGQDAVMATEREEPGDTDMTMVRGRGLNNSIGAVTTGSFGPNWEDWGSSQQVGVDRERGGQFSFDRSESEVPQKSQAGCRPRKAIRFDDWRTWEHFRRMGKVGRGIA